MYIAWTFWITQAGCIKLYIIVACDTTITNFWEFFCHGVGRNHLEKDSCLQEYTKSTYFDCFHNPFLLLYTTLKRTYICWILVVAMSLLFPVGAFSYPNMPLFTQTWPLCLLLYLLVIFPQHNIFLTTLSSQIINS